MFSLGFKYGKECEENNILNSFLKLCEIKNTNLTINEATIAIEKEEKLIINEKNRLISLFNKDGKEKIYFQMQNIVSSDLLCYYLTKITSK
ncbi:MAG: hypothetical protein KBF12_09355 [Sebaldella sp.]|nr:hypothetical protein [Sebaldella sp.]